MRVLTALVSLFAICHASFVTVRGGAKAPTYIIKVSDVDQALLQAVAHNMRAYPLRKIGAIVVTGHGFENHMIQGEVFKQPVVDLDGAFTTMTSAAFEKTNRLVHSGSGVDDQNRVHNVVFDTKSNTLTYSFEAPRGSAQVNGSGMRVIPAGIPIGASTRQLDSPVKMESTILSICCGISE